jgi:hypothetical protein
MLIFLPRRSLSAMIDQDDCGFGQHDNDSRKHLQRQVMMRSSHTHSIIAQRQLSGSYIRPSGKNNARTPEHQNRENHTHSIITQLQLSGPSIRPCEKSNARTP